MYFDDYYRPEATEREEQRLVKQGAFAAAQALKNFEGSLDDVRAAGLFYIQS